MPFEEFIEPQIKAKPVSLLNLISFHNFPLEETRDFH